MVLWILGLTVVSLSVEKSFGVTKKCDSWRQAMLARSILLAFQRLKNYRALHVDR